MLHRHQKYEVFLTWIYGGWGGIFDDCACWCWFTGAFLNFKISKKNFPRTKKAKQKPDTW